HHAPLHDRPGADLPGLDQGGPLLGVVDDARFQIGGVHLDPCDQVAIFTDGIVEARSRAGAWFGADRLARLVAANRGLSARSLVEHVVLEVRAFAGVADFDDDVTLVVLRRPEDCAQLHPPGAR
ncbi:MAG TPA: PP2C family protein-serine/threonine phosphatase, partial [Candidatus Eisenbacteria bacterium]